MTILLYKSKPVASILNADTVTIELEELAAKAHLKEYRPVWLGSCQVHSVNNKEISNIIRRVRSLYRDSALIAAAAGELDAFEWLLKEAEIENRQAAFMYARNYGHFRDAAGRGQLHVLQWLWRKADKAQRKEMLAANSYEALNEAVSNGYLHIAQWLWFSLACEQRVASINIACQKAASNGRLAIVQWFWDQATSDQKSAVILSLVFLLAAKNGHISIMQWVWGRASAEQQLKILGENNFAAFAEGSLQVKQWLWSKAAPIMQAIMLDVGTATVIDSTQLVVYRWIWQHLTLLGKQQSAHVQRLAAVVQRAQESGDLSRTSDVYQLIAYCFQTAPQLFNSPLSWQHKLPEADWQRIQILHAAYSISANATGMNFLQLGKLVSKATILYKDLMLVVINNDPELRKQLPEEIWSLIYALSLQLSEKDGRLLCNVYWLPLIAQRSADDSVARYLLRQNHEQARTLDPDNLTRGLVGFLLKLALLGADTEASRLYYTDANQAYPSAHPAMVNSFTNQLVAKVATSIF